MTQGSPLEFPFLSAEFEASDMARAMLDVWAGSGVEERGAIYTRREVVEFILDLAGYTPDKPLHRLRVLEPSFGEGDFLLPWSTVF